MLEQSAPRMIFVNLPVSDLEASIAFYEAAGAVRNDDFADESTQMVSFSDMIHVMLLTQDRFRSFTPRRISNAHETAQMALALTAASREAVDDVVERALAAGGTEPNPVQDHGFLYSRGFADLDGHMWDSMWMDVHAAIAAHRGAHAVA